MWRKQNRSTGSETATEPNRTFKQWQTSGSTGTDVHSQRISGNISEDNSLSTFYVHDAFSDLTEHRCLQLCLLLNRHIICVHHNPLHWNQKAMSVTHGAALVKAVVCLTVSVSLRLSIQWHHCEGQGQALPPRVLHVRWLRRQPQAERLLLHRGQPVLWDPRQGTRPASRGLRCCCSLPQLQGGAGLRRRWSHLYCTILKSGRTGLQSILAYIYQALSSRNLNLDQFCFWEGHKKFSDPRSAFLQRQMW